MFTLKREKYGVIYTLPAVFVNDAITEHLEADVLIEADGTAELDVFGIGCTAKFIEDITLTEFAFPLQASDFATERTGTLSLTITDSLSDGLYLAYFVAVDVIMGIFAGGPFGLVQGGNETRILSKLSTYIQIQMLTDNYAEQVAAARQYAPYPVQVVTRL